MKHFQDKNARREDMFKNLVTKDREMLAKRDESNYLNAVEQKELVEKHKEYQERERREKVKKIKPIILGNVRKKRDFKPTNIRKT